MCNGRVIVINLCRDRGLNPGPPAQKSDTLPLDRQVTDGRVEFISDSEADVTMLFPSPSCRYNYMMALLSILFLIVSWGLTTLLGGVGFILANCCNMAARIAHSVQFIQEKYHDTTYQPLKGLVPGSYFLGMLVFTGTLTKISEMNLFDSHKLLHLCIGAVSFALVLLAWGYEERELVRLGVNRLRWRRSSGAKQS
uniref:Protein RFT1 homolog n=1 Tax=Timema californicum TaxID=61474 RepID=A0A7R9P723_TIMCA|nr:unnamed protein product [Timema californicum]